MDQFMKLVKPNMLKKLMKLIKNHLLLFYFIKNIWKIVN